MFCLLNSCSDTIFSPLHVGTPPPLTKLTVTSHSDRLFTFDSALASSNSVPRYCYESFLLQNLRSLYWKFSENLFTPDGSRKIFWTYEFFIFATCLHGPRNFCYSLLYCLPYKNLHCFSNCMCKQKAHPFKFFSVQIFQTRVKGVSVACKPFIAYYYSNIWLLKNEEKEKERKKTAHITSVTLSICFKITCLKSVLKIWLNKNILLYVMYSWTSCFLSAVSRCESWNNRYCIVIA